MAQSSTGFGSYMAERVSSTRWELYKLRFLVFFFLLVGISGNVFSTLFDHPARVLAPALLLSLAVSASSYWTERHGRGTRVELIVLIAILLILLGIVWYGIQRHGHILSIN